MNVNIVWGEPEHDMMMHANAILHSQCVTL